MPEIITIDRFLELSAKYPVVDVRSPIEFAHASFPGAISFPLMNNEERAIIGTTFKQEGRSAAVLKGYEIIGPKFSAYLKEAISMFPDKKVVMYCWRGGLRSNIMSFLFETADIKVFLLKGGYKAYRNKTFELLEQPLPIWVLGGMTGSGKTKILKELSLIGETIIDLEALACHRGSAFGGLGEAPQPGYEQFENLLALEIYKATGSNRVWVENESRMIGKVKIPDAFYSQMRTAQVIEVILPEEERIQEIKNNYCSFPVDTLLECTLKLKKKLGDLRTRQATDALISGNFEDWIKILLVYYDENYLYSSSLRFADTVTDLSFEKLEPKSIAKRMIQLLQK
jgi:tRNA 2-selenouridine synthase